MTVPVLVPTSVSISSVPQITSVSTVVVTSASTPASTSMSVSSASSTELTSALIPKSMSVTTSVSLPKSASTTEASTSMLASVTSTSTAKSVGTSMEKSIPISTGQNSERQSVSTHSPFASSLMPPQLFQKDYVVTSSQHGRSVSVPLNAPTESRYYLRLRAGHRVLKNKWTGESNDRFGKQSSTFKLPPQIHQSIFCSNAPVNVPSSSRSISQSRDSRSATKMNDLCGGGGKQKQGHVPRSRSETHKSPGRRKLSNVFRGRKVRGQQS